MVRKKIAVAYFSLEIALEKALPTYAGGLGILAGDILRSAGDINFPMVGVTLLNRRGYLKQRINSDGEQISAPEKSYAFGKLEKTKARTTVIIGQEKVFIQAWRYLLAGESISTPVYLLDTNCPENSPTNRRLTDRLYDSDKAYRLRQEIVLGRGGVKILKILGYDIKKYHLNEGHGSLATVELMLSLKNFSSSRQLRSIREKCVFTVHTPLPGAQDIFAKDFFLSHQLDWPKSLNRLFKEGKINMTKLGLHCCGYVNAVSRRHQKVSEKMFPGQKIDYITNGVNSSLWTNPWLVDIYDACAPGWRKDASVLSMVQVEDLNKINIAHLQAKRELIKHIKKITGASWSEEKIIIGFARRFTPYKRPGLIFQDISYLKKIAKNFGGLQMVFSGKAHPNDLAGQALIKELSMISQKLAGVVDIVFLPNYNIDQAKLLVSGSDLWLNTPEPPLEASGTSGMKAAHNGVPQLSTNDGWWPEGYKRARTGWLIKENSDGTNNLYDLLEKEILPIYYYKKEKWLKIMRSTISLNAPIFNTGRVLSQYIDKAYRFKIYKRKK